MRWSLQIARIAGTVVQIHVTFFLLLAWIGGAYYLQGGLQAAIDGTLFILLIFACVLLHEFGHALAARRYGIPTPTITLLPIGGVARLQRMPDEPREELVVHTTAVLNDALQLMQSEGHPALPVVDEQGRLVGVLSLESVGELLMLRDRARPSAA